MELQFHSENKFEKLVHLVGFIVRIYHDARPHERQKCVCVCVCVQHRSLFFKKSRKPPFVSHFVTANNCGENLELAFDILKISRQY